VFEVKNQTRMDGVGRGRGEMKKEEDQMSEESGGRGEK
jgi:hypothetical protein